ncbi:MAG: hypothetical protein AAGI28_09935 [Pseudomonadota bacterium]
MTVADLDAASDPGSGRTQIAWARRSMSLSAAAAAELKGKGACHIGLALPVDRALASLGLWLLEAGFEVSAFVSPGSARVADSPAARLTFGRQTK